MSIVFAVKDPETLSKVKRIDTFQKLPLKRMYSLPDPAVVERASRRLGKERKMWRTLLETAVCMLLLALLFTVAYGSTDRRSFYINKSILDTFVKARHTGNVAITEVL
ncbi:hypothetical protein LSAT2_023049 [Lamellibrachia satsuma]|nr:hypothetical protein LSAT2_023049 [Lamellibrachia satsuma]